jgi:hypothetical protein
MKTTQLDHGYAIAIVDRANQKTECKGLTHVEAMTRAEQVQREGGVARVLHVIGDVSHEVDSYPPR